MLSGRNKHCQLRPLLPRLVCQRQTIHRARWHVYVCKKGMNVVALIGDYAQRLSRMTGFNDLETFSRQYSSDSHANQYVVFCNENAGRLRGQRRGHVG